VHLVTWGAWPACQPPSRVQDEKRAQLFLPVRGAWPMLIRVWCNCDLGNKTKTKKRMCLDSLPTLHCPGLFLWPLALPQHSLCAAHSEAVHRASALSTYQASVCRRSAQLTNTCIVGMQRMHRHIGCCQACRCTAQSQARITVMQTRHIRRASPVRARAGHSCTPCATRRSASCSTFCSAASDTA
jgi:hypothetical protein